VSTDIDNITGSASATTGTGPLVLGAALKYHRSIQSVLSDGAVRTFMCVDKSGSDYMLFVGTYATSGTQITVGTIHHSSAGGSAVSWTGGNLEITIVASKDELDKPEKLTQLYDADIYKPIIIIAFGDSNNLGIGGTDAGIQTANTHVWVRASDGSLPRQDPATRLTWRNVDPHGTVVADAGDYSTLPPYWGLLRGNRITASYALADRVQKRTGRDVYLVTVGLGGTYFSSWLPTGASNDCFDSLNSYLRVALDDAIPGYADGEAYAHIVLVQLGANDNTAMIDPQTFADRFKETYDYFNDPAQNWAKPYETQWFLGGLTDDALSYWMGHQNVDNQTDNYVRIISGEDLPNAADGKHFLSEGHNAIGLVAADAALAGVSSKALVTKDGYVKTEDGIASGIAIKYDVRSNDIVVSTAGTTGGANAYATPHLTIGATTEWEVTTTDSFGAYMPTFISIPGVHSHTVSPLFNASYAIKYEVTIQNKTGVDVDLPANNVFADTSTIHANGQTISSGVHQSLLSNPTFSTTGGALTAASYTGFYSKGVVNTGATLTARFGVQIAAPTGAGTIGEQTGIAIQALTSAGKNTQLLLGTFSSPAGNWSVYQNDTLPRRWNGCVIRKTVKPAGAYTILITDEVIIAASGTTGNYTLPSLAAMTTDPTPDYTAAQMQGWTVIIKNNRSGALTVAAGASTTLPYRTSIASGADGIYTFDGVSVWS